MSLTWKTKEGLIVRIKDMDDKHLVNTISYLERTNQTTYQHKWDVSDYFYADPPNPVYEAMIAEAKRRKLT